MFSVPNLSNLGSNRDLNLNGANHQSILPPMNKKMRQRRSHSPRPTKRPPAPPVRSNSWNMRPKSTQPKPPPPPPSSRSRTLSPNPPSPPHSRSQGRLFSKSGRVINTTSGRCIPPPPSSKSIKSNRTSSVRSLHKKGNSLNYPGADRRRRNVPDFLEKHNAKKLVKRLDDALIEQPFIPSLIEEKTEPGENVAILNGNKPSIRDSQNYSLSYSSTFSKVTRWSKKGRHRRSISSPHSPNIGNTISQFVLTKTNRRRSSNPNVMDEDDYFPSSEDSTEDPNSNLQEIPIQRRSVQTLRGQWEVRTHTERDKLGLHSLNKPLSYLQHSNASRSSLGLMKVKSDEHSRIKSNDFTNNRGQTKRLVLMIENIAKSKSVSSIPSVTPEIGQHSSTTMDDLPSPRLSVPGSPPNTPPKWTQRSISVTKKPATPPTKQRKRRVAASISGKVAMLDVFLKDKGSGERWSYTNCNEPKKGYISLSEIRCSWRSLLQGSGAEEAKKEREILKPETKKSISSERLERPPLRDCYLEDIINRINHPNWSDERSKRILFMCYRGFCTRKELLKALTEYYWDPPLPPDFEEYKLSSEEDAEEKAKNISRIKLLNLIRYWLREFPLDFQDSDLTQIENWTNDILQSKKNSTAMTAVCNIMKEVKLIQSGDSRRLSKNNVHDYPQYLWDPDTEPKNIFNVPCEEIARQMCLMDHEIFASIRPHEFLGQSWKKKDRATEAPNILRIIDHFNKICCWSQIMILHEIDLRKRAHVLSRLLKICESLDNFNNLNSLCAIMAGIRSTSIFRLKKTFGSLKTRHTKLLLKYNELMKSDKNQKNLRLRMKNLVQPGIPHVGLFLSDILYIDDGNVSSIDGKINFHKYTLLNERIEWCLLFQNFPFHFRRLEKVQAELYGLFKIISQDFLYNLSLSLESRTAVPSGAV